MLTAPPNECPTSDACASPSPSMKPRSAPAKLARRYRVRGFAEAPKPGRSRAKTVARLASGPMLCRQVSANPPQTVDEDDGGPAAFDDIVEAEPVDLTASKLQFRHGVRFYQRFFR